MFKVWVIYHWLRLSFRKKFKTRAELLAWQKKKLDRFQHKTLKKSPFYQQLLDQGYKHADFPIISKEEFVDHFGKINTLGLAKEETFAFAIQAEKTRDFQAELKGCTVGLSTGTSGNRSVFLAAPSERALWAAQIFSRVVKPKWFRQQKVAFILRANSNLYESVKSSFFKFKFFDLSLPIDILISQLNDYKPDILSAQPSLLTLLAKAKHEKQLHITPTQIISYAEVLDEFDRKKIEQAFGKIITEVYQCTEGFLGHTCEYGSMHLNEEIVRIERKPIDNHRFQPIVTDFHRTSQPVVRYLMNDILQESPDPCPCGSPCVRIEKIEGRMDEVLLFESGENPKRIYPDFIRRTLVMADSRIENYQVVQDTATSLRVYIACASEHFPAIEGNIHQALQNLLSQYEIESCEIHFHHGLLPKAPDQKLQRIKRIFVL